MELKEQQPERNKQQCRFYQSKRGCRNGDACRFLHDRAAAKASTKLSHSVSQAQRIPAEPHQGSVPALQVLEEHKAIVRPVRKTAPRPTMATTVTGTVTGTISIPTTVDSLLEEARKVEVAQLERRFPVGFHAEFQAPSSASSSSSSGQDIRITLAIPPSDPDFPFELDALVLECIVPATPAAKAPPSGSTSFLPAPATVRIRNEEIPEAMRQQFVRGLERLKVEDGKFQVRRTLVQWANWIDRNMEALFMPPSARLQVPAKSLSNSGATRAREVGSGGADLKEQGAGIVEGMKTIKFVKHKPVPPAAPSIQATESEDSSSLEETAKLPTSPPQPQPPASPPLPSGELRQTVVSGTQMYLPDLHLQHVSLLQCSLLSLLVQCSRCKTPVEVLALLPRKPRTFTCRTCRGECKVLYRPEAVHAQSTSLGYLNLEGCVIADYLSSQLEPTCEQCSNDGGWQEDDGGDTGGVDGEASRLHQFSFKKVTRGQKQSLSCRFCHTKMVLQVDDVRFKRVGGAEVVLGGGTATSASSSPAVNKKKALVSKDPNIVPGNPLPHHGACKHYGKSYRSRAFPCDLCHEDQNRDGHEMKWANRMICGHCSREQPYASQKPCQHCGQDMTQSTSTRGFWEGGKGVRDRTKMSRKDEHKFKGTGKTMSRKKQQELFGTK